MHAYPVPTFLTVFVECYGRNPLSQRAHGYGYSRAYGKKQEGVDARIPRVLQATSKK